MRFCCLLVDVKNTQITRSFYENVMRLKISLDLPPNVAFGNGKSAFAIQENFSELVNTDNFNTAYKGNDHELVFEEDNYDEFEEHIKQFKDIIFVHKTKEYPWGQRVMRFYDPDFHVIEVGESMESIFKKFFNEGMSINEVAERTGHPVEFVSKYSVFY